MEFETWLAAVDTIMVKRFGTGLTLQNSRQLLRLWNLWDAGLSPRIAIVEYLEIEEIRLT